MTEGHGVFPSYKIVNVASLVPYARNARTHSEAQVDKIAASISEFGFTNPIITDGKNGIIAGHGRVMAAQKLGIEKVPTIEAAHMTEAQKKAYILADNRLAFDAGWDNDLLKIELQDLDGLGFDLELTGFDVDEIAASTLDEPAEGLTDEDAVPDVPAVPITVEGDVWLLGRHRLMCGDSTSIDAVERLMDGQRAALLHADPPYGMGKERAGVANDNLYGDKLDAFQMKWWATFQTFVEDNASVYIWGKPLDLWRLWLQGGLGASKRLTFKNQIVWNKKAPFGVRSAECRNFPTATEHCMFFMIGEKGFNNNYWEGFEPIRSYLQNERDTCGMTSKTVAALFGFHPRMANRWFSKSKWSFPQLEQYETIKKAANGKAFKRDYEDLKRDYEKLKRELYSTRAYFDNTHEKMMDVWEYFRVQGAERHGHATPKPVAMMKRIMRSSLPAEGICVEPFGGSGSTLMGCEATGRICYTMEIKAVYCDVIIKRWQSFTGQQATIEATGQTFAELAALREAS